MGFEIISRLKCFILFSIALHFFLAIIIFSDSSYKPNKSSSASNRFVVRTIARSSTSTTKNDTTKIYQLDSKNLSAERFETYVPNAVPSKKQTVEQSAQTSDERQNIESQKTSIAAQQENGNTDGSSTPHVLTPPLSLVLTWPKNLADEVSVVVLATLNQQAIELVVKSSSGSVVMDEYAVNYIRQFTSKEKFQSWPQELSIVLRK